MGMQVVKRFEEWLRNLIHEEVSDVVKHREHRRDNTGKLARLILELDENKLSLQSIQFLQELNINPEKYLKEGSWR